MNFFNTEVIIKFGEPIGIILVILLVFLLGSIPISYKVFGKIKYREKFSLYVLILLLLFALTMILAFIKIMN